MSQALFTKTDKVLLDRAARHLKDAAAQEYKFHGPVWSATAEGKAAKRVYDRLLRDERDLRALAKRLESLNPPPAQSSLTIGQGSGDGASGD